MATEALAPPPESAEAIETHLGTVRLEGERHSLVWIRNPERTVSILVDRPDEGSAKVRLLGAFFPDESLAAIETLIADFRRNYVEVAAGERIPPRALEPGDLLPPERRDGGDRVG
jgi:hypothetical protein